jgi:hypothetical protein
MLKVKIKEHRLYFFIIMLMNVIYVGAAFGVRGDALFGFNQLRHLKPLILMGLYSMFALAILAAPKLTLFLKTIRRYFVDRPWQAVAAALVLAILAALVFFKLRSFFINEDGLVFQEKFETDIPEMGAHVTHDEIWELYLHSRFWDLTNQRWGWSVPMSYQVLSSLAGGMFVFLLLLSQYRRDSGFLFAAGILAGGSMQLFFGDVENYTLTSLLIFAYLWAGILFLEDEITIIWPSGLLALAMMFHLLSGWLLPSLAYLYWLALKRKAYRTVLIGMFLSALIVAGTLTFFHFNGLPIEDLFNNSNISAQGGNFLEMLSEPSLSLYWQLINLLFLLFPPLLFFVPLLLYGRIQLTLQNGFFLIASLFMLIFMTVWKPGLGVYGDWNLFAPSSIPLAILFWINFLKIEDLKYRDRIFWGIVITAAIHSYAWIISNHYYLHWGLGSY